VRSTPYVSKNPKQPPRRAWGLTNPALTLGALINKKQHFLRPGFVMELRRGLRYATEFWVPDNDIPGSSLRYEGLRYATSERKIGVFVKFMKYAGKFLRRNLLTEDYLSYIIFTVFV
jgi:hypothetical protein